jgi:2'-hydroxyisoflavone reductase
MNLSRRDFLATSAALGALSAMPRAQQNPASASGDAPRVLVLGGTGFLGPHVVDACKARGWKLTLFNRGKTRPTLFAEDKDVEDAARQSRWRPEVARGRRCRRPPLGRRWWTTPATCRAW